MASQTSTQGKDDFSNPFYDQLLIRFDNEAESWLEEVFFKKWLKSETAAHAGEKKPTGDIPAKPPLNGESVYVTWQLTLNDVVAKPRKTPPWSDAPVITAVGVVDLAITFSQHELWATYSGGKRVWDIQENARNSVLYVLCRPVLTSVAATIREIQKFRNRKRELANGEDDPDRKEYFAVLTTNQSHKETFMSQGIYYIVFNKAELQKRIF